MLPAPTKSLYPLPTSRSDWIVPNWVISEPPPWGCIPPPPNALPPPRYVPFPRSGGYQSPDRTHRFGGQKSANCAFKLGYVRFSRYNCGHATFEERSRYMAIHL